MTTHSAVFLVHNPSGLHARPAARFVDVAKRQEATVTLRCGDRTANAKSLIGIMKLGVSAGSQLTLTAEGVDAGAALACLVELLGELDHETPA